MDKKSKIRAGLFFGVSMAVFFILWDLFINNDFTQRSIIISLVSGVIEGAISGFIFAWLIALFVNSKFLIQSTKIEIAKDETILFETGANHFKGAEAVGGKLYLTNQRLVFKSHKFNIQKHELSIGLSDIAKVDRYKTLGLVNNGLMVMTSENTTEKFVVQQIEEWVSQLSGRDGLLKVHA